MNRSRRRLFGVAFLMGLLIVAACSREPKPVAERQLGAEKVVKETVVVEKEVEK